MDCKRFLVLVGELRRERGIEKVRVTSEGDGKEGVILYITSCK